MAHLGFRRTVLASLVSLTLLVVALAVPWGRSVQGADHREAPFISLDPAADIADTFVFVSPVDPTMVVFAMTVNGFAVPGVRGSYSFDPDVLYQIKIDNRGAAVENLVIQINFAGFETDRDPRCSSGPGGQFVRVRGPARPSRVGALNERLGTTARQVTGCTNQVLTGSGGAAGIRVFAGLRDDPFVTDPAQLNRILGGAEQVFRAIGTGDGSDLANLDGRPVVLGRSGFDTFGGFNVSAIAVEVPISMVQGNRSRTGTYLVNNTTIGVWATTSRRQTFVLDRNEDNDTGTGLFLQIQRAAHQLFKTVFVPSTERERFNRSTPANDLADLGTFSGPRGFSRFIPDTLTSNDPSNTIAARAGLLTALGLDTLPNGAPLLPGVDALINTDLNLARHVILPDVLRIDLALTPPNDFVLLNNGLQNGRRLDDDVTDILLRVGRQLLDVKFPDGSGVPGDGPLAGRRALDCSALPNCPDRRVLAVLQGTDFIEMDADVPNLANSGQDRPLLSVFPFLGEPHPLPGNATPAPGTVGYPVSPGND